MKNLNLSTIAQRTHHAVLESEERSHTDAEVRELLDELSDDPETDVVEWFEIAPGIVAVIERR